MPEGDTIFRTARTLHKALAGKEVTHFQTVLPKLAKVVEDRGIVGRTILSAEAKGKWCLLHFSEDLTLLTHMLMSGSFHIYRQGEPWKRARSSMRIVIETRDFVAVAFQVPVAEFHTAESLNRHRAMTIGPDLLRADFDANVVFETLRNYPHEQIAEALLNQSILAGIGNVYKSEVCFLTRVHPFEPIGNLTDEKLQEIIKTSQRLLQTNVIEPSQEQVMTYFGPRRTTHFMSSKDRLWVYGRLQEPCRRCHSPIQMKKQGIGARVTFFCPQCQPLKGENRGPAI